MAFLPRTYLHLLVGLLVSLAAVYLSLRKIDFAAFWSALNSADYVLLLPAAAVQLLCFLLKGMGWRYLLIPAKKEIRLTSTTSVLVIGLMVNNLFPAKMGELARAYLIGEKEKLSKSLCLSTILVEHLLDILVLSVFLFLLFPAVPLPPWLRTGGSLLGFLALGLVGLLFLVVRREEKFWGWARGLLRRVPGRFRERIQSFLNNLLQGLRVVAQRYIYYAFAALLGMWSLVSLVAYLVLAAFGLFLPIHTPVMVTIFTAFGKILPSSPGAIGTFHYLVIVVLTAFGVSKEAALAYAIVYHGLIFLIEVASGIAAILTGNLSLGRIAWKAEESP